MITRPAVKKETAVFPRDASDSLPPHASQDPMTPGLIDMERKMAAYLRRKDEVAAGVKEKAPTTAKTGEADKDIFEDSFQSKGHIADVIDFSREGYHPDVVRPIVDAVEKKQKQYGDEIRNKFDFLGSMRRHIHISKQRGNDLVAKNIKNSLDEGALALFSGYKNSCGISFHDDLLKGTPEEIKDYLAMLRQRKLTVPGSDTLKSMADHEYGHSLDDVLNLRNDEEIKSLFTGEHKEYRKKFIKENSEKRESLEERQSIITNELSKYGSTEIGEFIAEGLSEYWNTDNPRFFARKIGGIMEKRYAAFVGDLKKEK